MRSSLSVAVVLASLVAAPHALAQPTPDPAIGAEALARRAAERLASFIKSGVEQCEHGELDGGIAALSSAFAQQPEPGVAASLAACEVSARQWASATQHLAFALRKLEEGPERTRLVGRFNDACKHVGAVRVTVNVDDAYVFVQNRYVGQSPLPGDVYVDSGRSVISAKRIGYDETEKAVELIASGSAAISIELPPTGATAPRYAVAARTRTPVYVLGGLALAAGSAGGALAVVASIRSSAADDLLRKLGDGTTDRAPCRAGKTECPTVLSLRREHDTLMNAGVGALVGGGVLLGAAVLSGVWAFQAPAPRTGSITVAPVISLEGGALRVRGTF